jgi:DNA-binding transcriptional regulator YiaG
MDMHTTYITNEQGHRTHVVIPIEEWEWLNLPSVPPDKWDQAAIREIRNLSSEDLKPAPITNPIRKARYKAGLSQADLAGRMGITAGMLSRMEREGRKLRATTLARALQALKS